MKLVFVGELNPYGADPYFALYHLPRNASGNRLREILGLTDVEYSKIAKVNLCTGQWSAPAARRNADLLFGRYAVIVGLGAKVRAALDGPEFFQVAERRGSLVAILPHPSGRNLLWNDDGARERARQLLAPFIAKERAA